MDARELLKKMNYSGMERAARCILLEEKLTTMEELAIMTEIEVCEKLLESYEVVFCDYEDIAIVRKEDVQTYDSIIKYLSR